MSCLLAAPGYQLPWYWLCSISFCHTWERISTGISTHLSIRAWWSSPKFWGGLSILVIVWPNSSQYVLWGCSLAILQAALSWWRCPAAGNQGLPEHGELRRYHFGSSSYPQNATCQMTLRCFTKCPCKAHLQGIWKGAQEAIWHLCDKLPRCVPNHHQLGPISLAPLLEVLTR